MALPQALQYMIVSPFTLGYDDCEENVP